MLTAAARALEVQAQFSQQPQSIQIAFEDDGIRFVKANGRLVLGNLTETHAIYKKVVHREMDALEGTQKLTALLKAEPIYGVKARCFFAFILSGIICPLAFGGSFLDMWVAAFCGLMLCFLQLVVRQRA